MSENLNAKNTENSLEETSFLPQGPNCVKNLINIALRSINHLPSEMKQEMKTALQAFNEFSIPVAWSVDDINANFSKSEQLFTNDFPKDTGFPSNLTNTEYREIFTSLIQSSKDEVAQEKISDIANIVFDRRNDLKNKKPKI